MNQHSRKIWIDLRFLLPGLILMMLVGCSSATTATPADTSDPTAVPTAETRTLRVMSHDSFAISEQALKAFESENGVKVQFLKSGDTGSALNKAILAKDNPLADVFYGVDNTFLSRALEEGIFDSYASPLLADIPDRFKLDGEMRALPVDYGDICLNYDIAFLKERGLAPPQSLDDLAKPEYQSLLVVENPATSSPGLAFLLATIAHFGEAGYLGYWQKLVENDVLVVDGWETAYYTEFSGSSGQGPRPMVVSYNSSPVFELIYAESELSEPPTAAIVEPDTCFRQIEFVGILKGTRNRDLAEKWVDFMLSPAFQQELPMQMFVLPVNQNAALDETFSKYLQVTEDPAEVDPQMIAGQREKWLNGWTETVLR